MSRLVEHATSELARIRDPNDERPEVQDARDHAIIEIVRILAIGEFFDGAASDILETAGKLARLDPLEPAAE